jgi:hypothetical protein
MNNLIIEVSSTKDHTILKAVSLQLVTISRTESTNGQIGTQREILVLHQAEEHNFESQQMVIKMYDGHSDLVTKILYITDGYLKISQETDSRTKVSIVCFDFGFDNETNLKAYNRKLANLDLELEQSDDLIKTELLPTLTQNEQQYKDVETKLRAELEKEL